MRTHPAPSACASEPGPPTSVKVIRSALSPASFFMCSKTRGKLFDMLSMRCTLAPCSSSTSTVWLPAPNRIVST